MLHGAADLSAVSRLRSLAYMGSRSTALGVSTAAVSLALTTLVLYPLSEIAPPVSLGVLYLLAVLLVSTVWGLRLGLATSLAAALAFNFFHLPPTGRFTIAEAENWVALVVFLVAAVVASTLASWPARAPVKPSGGGGRPTWPPSWRRCCWAAPTRTPRWRRPRSGSRTRSRSTRRRSCSSGWRATSGMRPSRSATSARCWCRAAAADVARDRIAPALEALLGAALEREALTREVVETSALRRSDEIKTAVLRSVSHDLRSPLTAIVAAGEALSSASLDAQDRVELTDTIAHESRRLARLVDQLSTSRGWRPGPPIRTRTGARSRR